MTGAVVSMKEIVPTGSLLCIGAVALMFISAAPAGAQTAPAVDFTMPGLVSDGAGFTVGYQFTANVEAAVVGLATWNDSSFTPAASPADVGLWDADGNLLGSATVTPSSPTIGVADWWYAPITPITPNTQIVLTPGATYTVGSFGAGANFFTSFTTGATVDPRITFVQDSFVASNTLQFPNDTLGIPIEFGGGDFGGNVILGTVPEPSTWAMMLAGFAVLGLAGYHRSRKAAAPAV